MTRLKTLDLQDIYINYITKKVFLKKGKQFKYLMPLKKFKEEYPCH